MRFNGKDAWINCGSGESLQGNGDMSFEMWVRFNGPVLKWAPIFGDYPLHNFMFQRSGYQSLVLYLRNETSDYNVESMAIPVDRDLITEKWSHVAVVVESPRCRFYLNGKLIHDAYVPFPVIDKAKVATKYLAGNKAACAPIDIDEFRLYQRALTPGEIKAHAQDQESVPVEDFELAIEPHWYNKTLTLRLSCKGIDLVGHTANISLQDKNQTIVAKSGEITLVETGINRGRYIAEVKFPLQAHVGKLLEGITRIKGPDGKVVKTVRQQQSLKKPDWVHSRAGYADGMLQPWTALNASQSPSGDVNVDVWGRTHVFGQTSFLKQVNALGAYLLSSPVTMKSKVDGKVVLWKNNRVKMTGSSQAVASFTQTRENDAITMRINTTVEYDGFITYECEIKAIRDLAMDELTLDIPLKTQHAKYCYGDRVYPEKMKPRIPISAWYSGAIHDDLSFKFSGNIWLGDNERGLCWQAESDEYWHYGNKQKAIEILPRGDTTTFRAHLVDIPTQLSKGDTLKYKFALQATPNKPMVRDAWDLRIVRSEPYGKDLDLPTRKLKDGSSALQAYADDGIEYLFTNVNDIWPWPMPIHEEFTVALHRMFKAVHAHGLKAHDYVIHQRIAVDIPEFDIHGAHMAKQPMRWYVQNGPPNKGHPRPGPLTVDYGANSQGAIMHCPKSMATQDAYIHSLALRMATFGDDGVYLDGSNASPPCQNLMHGCGYRAQDGSIHNTYPVFAARQFIKRIYTVVKKNKPDGLVDLHCSFGFNPTSVAYSDVYWTGEQWWHLRGTGAEHIPDELSLDQFRTEFMGYQFGVPANMLAYRLGSKMDVAAISLLHDVPVRPNNTEHDVLSHKVTANYSQTLFKIWKLRDQFDAKNARKLFYWNNQDYVAVSPDHGHAFLLHHPKNGVLAYLCNLDREKQTISASFNLDKLGLAGRKIEVVNALTQEKINMTADGILAIPLNSMQWGYYWIKPTSAGK
jgi:hypothetical protein